MKPKFYIPLLPFLLFNLSSYFSYGQWTTTYLSEPVTQLGAVAYGNKAYFAGGTSDVSLSNKVEIYDVVSGDWTIDTLSVPRAFPAAVASAGKVFFAGGLDFNTLVHYAVVDIFDTLTQQWTTTSLSAPRMYIQAAAVGSKVLFAGGYDVLSTNPLSFNFTNVVDIYDTLTGIWSTQTLSQARAGMAVAVVGNLAIFAGGQTDVTVVSNRVDIYNASTDTWTTDTISEARAFCAAATAGNKVLIAGGVTNENTQSYQVDIYDAGTAVWSTDVITEARSFTTMGATACGKAYFIDGGATDLNCFCSQSASNTIDIYDLASGQWYADVLDESKINYAVVGTKNKILVGGGTDGFTIFNTVEVFTCQETGIDEVEANESLLQIFPNPVSETATLMTRSGAGEFFQIEISDLSGKLVSKFQLHGGVSTTINVADWSSGTYIVKLLGPKAMEIAKLIKN